MHVHSRYSGDSVNEPADIVLSYERSGIFPLVCDHNTTAGSSVVSCEIRQIAPEFPVILAEEIMTAEGEIIGLFLSEEIDPYLPADETIDAIHDQGALALVPHPFCSFRKSSALWRDTLANVAQSVDIIEGFNGRNVYEDDNRQAQEFARLHKKPVSAGSDSHRPFDLGKHWIALEPFSTPEGLLQSLTARTARCPFMPWSPAGRWKPRAEDPP